MYKFQILTRPKSQIRILEMSATNVTSSRDKLFKFRLVINSISNIMRMNNGDRFKLKVMRMMNCDRFKIQYYTEITAYFKIQY